MNQVAIVACKRCKAKKLKCDDEPITCKNCGRAGAPCTQVDSRSRREYARGYIETLLQRIDHLKSDLSARKGIMGPTTNNFQGSPVTPASHAYHGHDSVTSIARLVEAAVTTSGMNTSLFAIELEAARDTRHAVATPARPATLPSKVVADQLLSSYLEGLHLLHPILHRSKLLQELDLLYSGQEAGNGPFLFRINMVFAIGAVPLVRAGLHDVAPLRYYAAAMQTANEALGLAALEHAQSFLLILLFSLQHDIGIGSKWDLARVAMRICIENKMHQKTNEQVKAITEQMRRRVFWSCYVADRHSSSVLGRPIALPDANISVELPIDADDDLVESGNLEEQIFRGASEVSAHVQQIGLRQITSRITTSLRQETIASYGEHLPMILNGLLAQLDEWRDTCRTVSQPRNAYETIQWRDLNYFRERLKCFRCVVLLGREHYDGSGLTYLDHCQEAAAQVASLYRSMRTTETLILNWTCVHDMMTAGFSNLYCSLAQRDLARGEGLGTRSWTEQLPKIQATTSDIIDTLSYISERWPAVTTHARIFEALAGRVTGSVESTSRPTYVESELGLGTNVADMPESLAWDRDRGRHAEMWDAAMAAFLEEPLDLENIDWGGVDWEALQLFSELEDGSL